MYPSLGTPALSKIIQNNIEKCHNALTLVSQCALNKNGC